MGSISGRNTERDRRNGKAHLKTINSARLGPSRNVLALRITDVPNIPADSSYPYNRLEAHVRAELIGTSGRFEKMVRLDIVDDLLPLIDNLKAFSKCEAMVCTWGTSSAGIELDLRWNSSIDIRCCVKVGDVRLDRDEEATLRREDFFEVYEIVFVVVLPDIDVFLDGLREIAKFYPQYGL